MSTGVQECSVLMGIPGSPGVAIGTVVIIGRHTHGYPRRLVESGAFDSEIARFRRATDRAKTHLRSIAARVSGVATAHSVLEAYVLMVEDPMLLEEVERRVRGENRCAEWAVAIAIESIASELASAGDAYLRERSRDIEFVGEHVLRAFAHSTSGQHRQTSGPVVLVARDLSPADTAGLGFADAAAPQHGNVQPSSSIGDLLPGASVVAFVTEGGTRTSHTSITARALKLPAVVGVNEVFASVTSGDSIIVDGLRGVVTVRPTADALREAEARAARYRALTIELTGAKEVAARTRDGETIAVRANVEIPEEAREARGAGAEGVGLYRTEYLYIDRGRPPTEDEQLAAFRGVIDAMGDRPVVLRTFDIGGDKFASTFKLPMELNPMLGLRAVRLALSRPEVFLEHLRAMVRASAFGDVRIMVPMVSSLDELKWVREMLDKAQEQVRSRGDAMGAHIPLGVMIEVPSAAILADHFAREAEFMSIGTNDLIQYTLAVDRSSRRLAYLASPFDPAIVRLVHGILQAGAAWGCPVSVCGGMASDPLTAMLLLGLGVREFSTEVAAIPEIRETFRRVTIEEAQSVARRAIEMRSAAEVERALTEAFAPRLNDIMDAEQLT